jgi:hypothetical protein
MFVRLTGTEPSARERPGSWPMMYSVLAMPSDCANSAVVCAPAMNCIWTDGMFSE